MGTIHRALKIRIYPSLSQQELINKTLRSCRFIYNKMLDERQSIYKELKENKQKLYAYKYKTEKQYKKEFEWLKEVDAVALQQSRRDLDGAYSNFFKSLKGKRKGKASGSPKFKKKKNEESYRTHQNVHIDFENRKVKLPKLGWIKFRDERTSFEGSIKNITVRRTTTGKYFVSILFERELEIEPKILSPTAKVKGLDMSLENFFVNQDGNSPAYERLYRKYEPKLKKAQRRLSKKKKGLKNLYKALRKVSLIHEKIKNQRKEFTNQLSTKLVRENDVIVVESLSLKGMNQALNLGKSVMDLGYSSFVYQLQYKSIENDCILIQADKWFASYKTCSVCGFVNKKLTLDQRYWTCPNCGKIHNRDQNASQNLHDYGLKFLGMEQPDVKPVESKNLWVCCGKFKFGR